MCYSAYGSTGVLPETKELIYFQGTFFSFKYDVDHIIL